MRSDGGTGGRSTLVVMMQQCNTDATWSENVACCKLVLRLCTAATDDGEPQTDVRTTPPYGGCVHIVGWVCDSRLHGGGGGKRMRKHKSGGLTRVKGRFFFSVSAGAGAIGGVSRRSGTAGYRDRWCFAPREVWGSGSWRYRTLIGPKPPILRGSRFVFISLRLFRGNNGL